MNDFATQHNRHLQPPRDDPVYEDERDQIELHEGRIRIFWDLIRKYGETLISIADSQGASGDPDTMEKLGTLGESAAKVIEYIADEQEEIDAIKAESDFDW